MHNVNKTETMLHYRDLHAQVASLMKEAPLFSTVSMGRQRAANRDPNCAEFDNLHKYADLQTSPPRDPEDRPTARSRDVWARRPYLAPTDHLQDQDKPTCAVICMIRRKSPPSVGRIYPAGHVYAKEHLICCSANLPCTMLSMTASHSIWEATRQDPPPCAHSLSSQVDPSGMPQRQVNIALAHTMDTRKFTRGQCRDRCSPMAMLVR